MVSVFWVSSISVDISCFICSNRLFFYEQKKELKLC